MFFCRLFVPAVTHVMKSLSYNDVGGFSEMIPVSPAVFRGYSCDKRCFLLTHVTKGVSYHDAKRSSSGVKQRISYDTLNFRREV